MALAAPNKNHKKSVASGKKELNDAQLTSLVGEGDSEAFRLLFDRYRTVIYRFCVLMLGDRAAAEDVYQEAFLSLYQTCAGGEVIHNVNGFLLTIARRRCLNVLRDSRNQLSLDEVDEPSSATLYRDIALDQHLRRALLNIPPQYREALLLFEIEGYSYEEIAEQIDVSYDVVKNRIYRARKVLQEMLDPIFNEKIKLIRDK